MDRTVIDPKSLPTSAIKDLYEEATAAIKAIENFADTRKFWGMSHEVWRHDAEPFKEQARLWKHILDDRIDRRSKRK